MSTAPFPFRDVNPEDQQAASLDRLLAFIRQTVQPFSPYYRRMFDEQDTDLARITTYDEFRAVVPITTKQDIADNLADFTVMPSYPGVAEDPRVDEPRPAQWNAYREAAQQPGVRDLFHDRPESVRIREAFLREWQPIHFQSSGGSTGKALTTGYTYRDLDLQFRRSGAWWYGLCPSIGPEDKWLNLLPAAPHLAIYAGIIIPLLTAQPNFNTFGGKVMPTERQVELVAADCFSVIIAIPSYLTHWLRTARRLQREGRIRPINGIKVAYSVGEPITDAYRALLKGLFAEIGSPDVKVLEGMSSTELRTGGFYECAEGSKLHFDPEYFFAEILHPETREPVPWGSPGVFVWSHIDWRGTVILRYWTGDYVTGGMIWGTCPHCQLSLPRLITPIWRVERDFTKIRGNRVEFVALQDAVRGVPGVATFQIVIRKSDPADAGSRDLLEIYVAAAGNIPEPDVAFGITRTIRHQMELEPDAVVFASIPEIEARLFAQKLKAEWIVDRRSNPS